MQSNGALTSVGIITATTGAPAAMQGTQTLSQLAVISTIVGGANARNA